MKEPQPVLTCDTTVGLKTKDNEHSITLKLNGEHYEFDLDTARYLQARIDKKLEVANHMG